MKFLRIGSLNVRVKKTTEVFSNFLGVGSTNNSCLNQPRDQSNNPSDAKGNLPNIYKNWGSADNISKVRLIYSFPLQIILTKRKKKPFEFNFTGLGERNDATAEIEYRQKTIETQYGAHKFIGWISKHANNAEPATIEPLTLRTAQ